MRRIHGLLAAAALGSLCLVGGVTPTAEAASNCTSSGALACYYNGTNYTSTRGVIPDGAQSGPCQLGDILNYYASSLYNNSINTQTWYTGKNFAGSSITVARQSGRTTLSSTFNNNLRSWKGTCYGGTLRTPAHADNGPEPTPPPNA